MCFRDSILYQLYSKEAFSKIRRSRPCQNVAHSPQCECYTHAQAAFEKVSSKSSFWNHYAARDDWTGVRYPAGLEDLDTFAANNPDVHVTAFQIQGEKITIIWRSQRTEAHKRFIHIAWSQHLNMETLELEAHWYPIFNLSLFSQKIFSGTRQEEETCIRCLRNFSLAKDKNRKGEDVHQYDGKESARCRKFGLIKYRDVFCDLPIPENIRLTNKQKHHEDECSQFHKVLQTDDAGLSYITPPDELYFQFRKYSALVNHRYTGFWDTETFVTPLKNLCVKCELLCDAAASESQRERIYQSCLDSSHIRQTSSKCGGCSSRFRKLLLDHECDCVHEEKILGNCEGCHKKVENEFGICGHQKTKRVKKLDCSGYAFILKDNYEEKIVYSNSYYQESPDDIHPIRHFLNTLSGQIIPEIIAPGLVEFEPMELDDREEEAFQSAMSCYSCFIPFHELRNPEKDKMRDHDHISGRYRGAACRSCNGKLVLQREISIMAHNLSGFDSHLLMRNLVGFDSYSIIPRSKEQMVGISMVKSECGDTFGPEGKEDEMDGEEARECEKEVFRDYNRSNEKRTDVKVVFRDTKSFLSGSLERCTELLKQSNHNFDFLKDSNLCKTNGAFDSEKYDLLLRKGEYQHYT